MQTLTMVLTSSSGTFEITKAMNVLQWSIYGLATDAAFTYLGNAQISNGTSDLASTAVPLTGQTAYNSRSAPQNSPWEKIYITVSAGSIALELSTN